MKPLVFSVNEPVSELCGLRIIESVLLVEDGAPITVIRSWRERLLSWPWRPWQALVIEVPKRPYRGAIQFRENVWIMHPETVSALRKLYNAEQIINEARSRLLL